MWASGSNKRSTFDTRRTRWVHFIRRGAQLTTFRFLWSLPRASLGADVRSAQDGSRMRSPALRAARGACRDTSGQRVSRSGRRWRRNVLLRAESRDDGTTSQRILYESELRRLVDFGTLVQSDSLKRRSDYALRMVKRWPSICSLSTQSPLVVSFAMAL